jgi:hypothetical protein
MRRARFVTLAVTLALALAASPAPAEEAADPCTADIRRLCPDIKPGRRLQRCVQEHRAELSPECKAHLEARVERRRLFQEACSDDVRTYCVNAEAGRGRIRRCLEANEQRLSPECRDALEQIPEEP